MPGNSTGQGLPLLGFGQVTEDETVPFDDLANLHVYGRSKARSIPNEGMELATFPTGINSGWKLAEQLSVKVSPSEFTRQLGWVNAGDHCLQA